MKKRYRNTPLKNKALFARSEDPDALHRAGIDKWKAKESDDATNLIGKAIILNPLKAVYHFNLGEILYEKGEPDKAIKCFKKAASLSPNPARSYIELGSLLIRLGRYEEANRYYHLAIELQPDSIEACLGLGYTFYKVNEYEQAIEYYNKVIHLNPASAEAHYNSATIYIERRKVYEAIKSYQQAIAINPAYVLAIIGLGKALIDVGEYKDSELCLRRALDIKPDDPSTHGFLGLVLMYQNKLSEAISSFKKALDLDPNDSHAHCNIGNILMRLGNIQDAILFYQRAMELNPEISFYFSNILLVLHYSHHITPNDIYAQHQKWSERYELPLLNLLQPHTNDRSANRKIRIGYVSPDFTEHPVSYFFEPLLASHDRSGFEIFCYSNVNRADTMTQHLKDMADNWRHIFNKSDEDVAGMIRSDKIDILVDLAGHTGDNRMMVFARKPSPIQVTYLGYPNTTGLKTMDYRITDSYADPPGKTEHLYSEELIRLPHGFLCYQPPVKTPDVRKPPSLKEEYITFGCFNNRAKITPEMVRVWAKIINIVPNARIIFKFKYSSDPLGQKLFRDMLDQENIPMDRVELHDNTLSKEAHLDMYNRVDIALDTFPYNGTTTTCEALWMGVPVITLGGDVHVSRVGLSILSVIGLPEFVAGSKEEYREKAAGLAADIEKRIYLRSDLRSLMRSSPLMDAKRFTQTLEHEFRDMWIKWCET
jgi:predicted O-linked N-acetylglucosamine transferase (SPINDLY family)